MFYNLPQVAYSSLSTGILKDTMIGICFKIENGKIDCKVGQMLIIVGDCWLVPGSLLLSLAYVWNFL